jgi:predicted nucleic acid-binding protein
VIVLDTNVLSETLRAAPDPSVLTWIAQQSRPALFTTTVTRAELFHGVLLLPDGKRRVALLAAVRAVLDTAFAGQVLSFDSDAADAYAEIAAVRRAAGRPISQSDAMIAAIARSRGAGLATRNIRDFTDCGIALVDPWNAGS